MRRRRYFEGVNLAILVVFFMMMLWAAHEGWAAEVKYPTRPIQIIIAYQPGTTDMAIRPFTEKLAGYLGQPNSFVYKPGATGAIGASYAAEARPDGYTLFATPQAAIITCPLTQKGLDYTVNDFAPICRLVRTPIILAVKADSPLRSLKDVVEEAKKAPGKLNFATAGAFSTQQIPVEIFCKMAGIQLTHVPCAGTTPAVTALLGGHVSLTSSTMAPLTSHLKTKALRGIAVFQKERLIEFPEIPTFSELGYEAVYSNWYGIVAPKKIPKEVVNKLYAGFKKVLDENRKSIEDRLANMSLMLDFLGPEEFAASLKAESEVIEKVVKELMAAGK